MREPTPEDEARARTAIKTVESIKGKIALGAEFKRPKDAAFFADTRDRLKQYGQRTIVSEGQLSWLTSIDERMKARKT